MSQKASEVVEVDEADLKSAAPWPMRRSSSIPKYRKWVRPLVDWYAPAWRPSAKRAMLRMTKLTLQYNADLGSGRRIKDKENYHAKYR